MVEPLEKQSWHGSCCAMGRAGMKPTRKQKTERHTMHTQTMTMTQQTAQEPKHTSAPWRISLDSRTGANIISDRDGEVIARINKLTDSKKLEYDARLISAAPVMLEALQAVADCMIGSDNFIARQVRVAIVKATQ